MIQVSFHPSATAVPSMLSRMEGRAAAGCDAGLSRGAQMLKEMIVAHASGRPGPEVQTGNLVGSVRVKRLSSVPPAFRFQVAVDAKSDGGAPYPRFLETGTSRMPAYPFLGPAMAEFRPKFRELMVAAVGMARL